MMILNKKNRLFLLVVILPTILAIMYYGFMAADVYISESRFVVRSPERQTASPLGVLLKGTGFSRSLDDSYTIQDYILSRDALTALDEEYNLRASFGQGDFLSSFPGLDFDKSFENMHRYYQKVVNVQFDSVTAIGALTVRSFNAEDAKKINSYLLDRAEKLVNQLNERARQDLIEFAEKEVGKAEESAKKASLALAGYRNQKGVIDPERQTAIPLQQIAKLQDELIATKGMLSQLQINTKDNPQIPMLQRRIKILQEEIESESQKITGGSKSLASKAAEYQRLALDKEFADKQLASTMMSLEQARNEAQRQQLYLERIAQPNLPDSALEPRRLRAIAAVFILGLIAWGVLTMLIAGIKEHQD